VSIVTLVIDKADRPGAHRCTGRIGDRDGPVRAGAGGIGLGIAQDHRPDMLAALTVVDRDIRHRRRCAGRREIVGKSDVARRDRRVGFEVRNIEHLRLVVGSQRG